mgnify:CR=1 FL=1
MEGKRGNYIALAVTLLALGALLLCSQAALESARAGLNLCAQMIVPSLLPFFILSSLLQQLGLPGILGRWLSPVTQKLFGIGGAGASALLLGVTGGYPLGADGAIISYETAAETTGNVLTVTLTAECEQEIGRAQATPDAEFLQLRPPAGEGTTADD